MPNAIGEKIRAKDTYICTETLGVVAKRLAMLDTSALMSAKYSTSNSNKVIGVFQTAGTLNKNVYVATSGDLLVDTYGAIAIGDQLYAYGSSGKVAAVPVGVTPSANFNVVGIALEAVVTSADQIIMRFNEIQHPVAS